MAEKYDMLVKLIVIGESGTGKSCLLTRFVEERFPEDKAQTIGVEFGARLVDILGFRVKVQIWDTAGQERYRSITRSYYRGAGGALCVYDVTSRQSFDALLQWITAARSLAGPDIVIMMVGNKADLADHETTENDGAPRTRRQVTHLEASQFAQEHNLMMLETSAATGEYVEDAFIKVAKNAVIRLQEGGGPSGAAAASSADRRLLTDDDGAASPAETRRCCKGA